MEQKNKQLESLTWKYFWEQKIEEIIKGMFWLIIVGLFFGFCYIIGRSDIVGFEFDPSIEYNAFTLVFLQILLGLLTIFIGMTIIVFLFCLFKDIVIWLISNWELAKSRAERDLKIKSKSKRRKK